jgi:hypothetical protein
MSRYFDDDKITLGKDKKGSEPCRHDPTLVCEIEGVRFYGASRSRLNEKTLAFMNADLLINLTGMTLYHHGNQPVKIAPRRWSPLRKYFEMTRVEEIVIDWPDMGVIPAGRDFWAQLFALIKKSKKQNVVVFCIGGHGRTGTFIASLMTVILGIHGGKAIRAIRDGYCKEAVESKQQEDYVRLMTAKAEKGGVSPK